MLCDDGRELDRALPRHRSKPHRSVLVTNICEIRNAVEIDNRCGRDEAEIHHGQKALPASEKPRFALISREQADRRIDCGRSVVLEYRRLHCVSCSQRIRAISYSASSRVMIGEELASVQGGRNAK